MSMPIVVFSFLLFYLIFLKLVLELGILILYNRIGFPNQRDIY